MVRPDRDVRHIGEGRDRVADRHHGGQRRGELRVEAQDIRAPTTQRVIGKHRARAQLSDRDLEHIRKRSGSGTVLHLNRKLTACTGSARLRTGLRSGAEAPVGVVAPTLHRCIVHERTGVPGAGGNLGDPGERAAAGAVQHRRRCRSISRRTVSQLTCTVRSPALCSAVGHQRTRL